MRSTRNLEETFNRLHGSNLELIVNSLFLVATPFNAKTLRRKDNKISCCSVIPSNVYKINDIQESCRYYESQFISSLFFASIRLCVLALRVLSQKPTAFLGRRVAW